MAHETAKHEAVKLKGVSMLKIPLRGIDRTGTAKNAGGSWLVLPCFLLFLCLQKTM
jgi:hypothetical protein